MRDEVLHRVELSSSARLLYIDLDNRARAAGRWFIKQDVLAAELGFSSRHIRTLTAELEQAGLVRVERNRFSVTYILAWSDRNHSSGQIGTTVPPDRNHSSGLYLNVLNPVIKPRTATERVILCICGKPYPPSETVRCCGHVYGEAHAVEVEVLPLVREWLWSVAPRSLQAPDEVICGRCYSAADGLVPLYRKLRERAEILKTMKSYGLILAILGERKTA